VWCRDAVVKFGRRCEDCCRDSRLAWRWLRTALISVALSQMRPLIQHIRPQLLGNRCRYSRQYSLNSDGDDSLQSAVRVPRAARPQVATRVDSDSNSVGFL
jgi:hypothetical protein